jgi:hypothetical protein
MGAMAGPIICGHLTGLTRTFGWAFGLDAFASLFAGFIIGFLKRPKEFTKKEDLDKILTKEHSFDINFTVLIFSFTFVHEIR